MCRHFRRFVVHDNGPATLARFSACMGLQDYSRAFATLEELLDSPRALELEGLQRPWPDTWLHPAAMPAQTRKFYSRQQKALQRWARHHASSPWPGFFRACIHWRLYDLRKSLAVLTRLPRRSARRYGWLRYFSGVLRLMLRQYAQAQDDFTAALRSIGGFWQARCYRAETLLCLNRRREAWMEFERAGARGRNAEAGAWHGEALLWVGEYRQALRRLDQAARAGAWLGFGWRGAAHMLLGNYAAARRDLDRALLPGSRDAEAYLWRGELKRRMGMPRHALRDLNRAEALAGPNPWARFNRALAWSALGNSAAMRREFSRLPRAVIEPILKSMSRPWPSTDAARIAVLRAGLRLAGGVRRSEDYLQDLWKNRVFFASTRPTAYGACEFRSHHG
jgi:tetratricopeptide (TPR) repeat protein